MNLSMLNIGNGTVLMAAKVNAIVKFDSVRIKKEVSRLRESEDNGKLIDATKHKAIKSVIIMDNGIYALSNLTSDTLVKRLAELMGGKDA